MLRLALPLLILFAACTPRLAHAEQPVRHGKHESHHREGHSPPHRASRAAAAHHTTKASPAKPKPHASQRPATRPTDHLAPKPAPAPAPETAAGTAPAEPAKGSNTGLPIPRFVSLKTDEVNLRTGPGLRYPIEWLYHRRDLPVEVEREFEVWRLVADEDGIKGWVHQANLAARRTFVTIHGEHMIRSDAKESASAVAALKPGVVGRLRACDATADWCQVSVGEYRGWLKRSDFYGILPGEVVQP